MLLSQPICAQCGNGVVTSVADAGKMSGANNTYLPSYRQTQREEHKKKDEEKEREEIKMLKRDGAELSTKTPGTCIKDTLLVDK